MKVKTITVLIILLHLISCRSSSTIGAIDPLDRSNGMSREDYKDFFIKMNNNISGKASTKAEPVIPHLIQEIKKPSVPQIGGGKLISLSVTEKVPLRDVLMEIAKAANLDIEIDGPISGGITLTAKNKPVTEVLERVSRLGALRYSNKNGVLRFERDLPYSKTYSVEMLNLVRSGSGKIGVSTNVLSSGELSSGSSNNIELSYKGDLWKELEDNVKRIIESQPRPPILSNKKQESDEEDASADPKNPNGIWDTDIAKAVSLNRAASLITALTTSRGHKEVEEYLIKMQKHASAQVLIEAKVVEIELKDEYQAGVDWSFIQNNKSGNNATNSSNASFGTAEPFVLNVIGTAFGGKITSAIEALQTFGTTKTLSNPRINAFNNQQATMTFAKNRVYFEVKATVQNTASTTGGPPTQTVNVTSLAKTVPIGVILTLQPSIDLKTKEITMNVRPTLSTSDPVNDVLDPGVAITQASLQTNTAGADKIESKVPVVEVREMDTMLKIKSGDTMVIGGMMKTNSANKDIGIPFLSSIPLLGHLFKTTQRSDVVTETVIFITATIIPSSGNINERDSDILEKFGKTK